MNKLTIGWASRDVSTDKPIDIPGQFHIRVSTGIQDPLTVTALVIDNGSDLVCFISCDFVAIRPSLLEAVRDQIARRLPGFPVAKLIMSATHTHTGASYYDSKQVSTSRPEQVPHPDVEIASSDEYREFLSSRIADAVCEAYTGRSPGGIAFGYSYAVVGHSRRTVYMDDISRRPGAESRPGMMADGHAKMYGNTNDTRFSHYEAGADHFINLLYTFDSENRLTGAIINVPCPSQCSGQGRKLSADFWHDAREAIRRKHGDIFILPQTAAGGDISPRILHYQKAEQRRFALKYGNDVPKDIAERKDIAVRIACAFDETLEWARKDIRTEVPVIHTVETIELEKRMISDDEAAVEARHLAELEQLGFAESGTPIERLDHDSRLVAQRNRCSRILERHRTQNAEPRFPMEVHVVRIGDVAFATNSSELFIDYMHRIQARSPFPQTFIIQLTGNPADNAGYLCTERAAWGKGYSATVYCNQVSPAGGQELVEQTLRLLKDSHARA